MQTRPVNILVVIEHLGRGGAERQVHELVTRMDRDAFRPTVVTRSPDLEYRAMLEAAGVPVIVMDRAGWTLPPVPGGLAAVVRRTRADLLHAYLFPASWRSILASAFAGSKPVICAVRSTGSWMNARHRMMERWAMRRARAVVANAPSIRSDLLARTGLPDDRVRVIMNGVDLTVFRPGHSEARRGLVLGAGDRGPLVGYIGNLRQAKDPELFVRIAARVAQRMHSARFVIVGSGGLRDRLETTIREAGLGERLRLAGRRTDMPEVLRALDALVVTSRREGCCNVILEAMATGVPVVATAVGGNPDLVADGGTGWLFSHGDVEAGAERILRLIQDRDRAARMGRAGLERARRDFGIDTMVRATEHLYREVA